jgi:hypothetical protein
MLPVQKVGPSMVSTSYSAHAVDNTSGMLVVWPRSDGFNQTNMISCLEQARVSLESSDMCCCSRRGRVNVVLLTLHLQMEESIVSLQLLYLEGDSSLQRVEKGLKALDWARDCVISNTRSFPSCCCCSLVVLRSLIGFSC